MHELSYSMCARVRNLRVRHIFSVSVDAFFHAFFLIQEFIFGFSLSHDLLIMYVSPELLTYPIRQRVKRTTPVVEPVVRMVGVRSIDPRISGLHVYVSGLRVSVSCATCLKRVASRSLRPSGK